MLKLLFALLHKAFSKKREGGKELKILNVSPDPRDSRDRDYEFKHPLSASAMPDKYIIPLRYHSEVKSQKNIGSCASHVAADLVEMEYKIAGRSRIVPLSELWHYYVVRGPEYFNTRPEDSGQFLRDMCKVLKEKGIAPEMTWAYDTSKFNEKPPAISDAFASFYKIKSYHKIYTLENLRKSIALNHPVGIGVIVHDSFMRNKDGMIPMPQGNEKRRGGHALVALGYDTKNKLIKVKNSWNVGWGKGGYAWIPEQYFLRFGLDYWSVRV